MLKLLPSPGVPTVWHPQWVHCHEDSFFAPVVENWNRDKGPNGTPNKAYTVSVNDHIFFDSYSPSHTRKPTILLGLSIPLEVVCMRRVSQTVLTQTPPYLYWIIAASEHLPLSRFPLLNHSLKQNSHAIGLSFRYRKYFIKESLQAAAITAQDFFLIRRYKRLGNDSYQFTHATSTGLLRSCVYPLTGTGFYTAAQS